MSRQRFRWTRKLYREADSMSRFLSGYPYWAHERAPMLLRRYWALWEKHPQSDDRLLTPVQWRYPTWCPDGIPF